MSQRPDPGTWNAVAERYTSEFAPYELDLARDVDGIVRGLGIDGSRPIAELGCGSGHLSALLARGGLKSVLMDFSDVSLDKAREVFAREKLEAEFRRQDIFALDGSTCYALTWNSGVMEHFDDPSLRDALCAINRATEGWFVCIVPNPASVPYLLYRYAINGKGEWAVGDEYLRTNYPIFFGLAGFEVVETRYIGWEYTKHFFRAYSGRTDRGGMFDRLADERLLPETSAYLVAYVCRKVREAPAEPPPLPEGLVDTVDHTRRFDQVTRHIPRVKRRFPWLWDPR